VETDSGWLVAWAEIRVVVEEVRQVRVLECDVPFLHEHRGDLDVLVGELVADAP
jgi:hypothetical protein